MTRAAARRYASMRPLRAAVRHPGETLARPLVLSALRTHGQRRPVPLAIAAVASRLMPAGDPPHVVRGACELSNQFLAQRLPAGLVLGTWAMEPEALDLLESLVRRTHARSVVEIGSGVSTVCLARYLAESGDDGRVTALEESAEHAARTGRLLDDLGLRQWARLLHVPELGGDIATGRRTAVGVVDPDAVFDLAVIDGPAGAPGVRAGTLDYLLPTLAPGAVIVLDDAWRRADLAAAQAWRRRPDVVVDGVVPTRKGVLLARVTRGLAG